MVVRPPPATRVALAAALLITLSELAVLLAMLASSSQSVVPPAATSMVERVHFLVPQVASPTPSRIATTQMTPGAARAITAPAFPPLRLRAESSMVRSALSAPVVANSPSLEDAPHTPVPSLSAAGTSGTTRGPVLGPRGFNSSTPLTRRVIDSVLDSLNANMPALIWARAPTQAERDATYKEGALAMRLSGRTLLVPADPHLVPGIRISPFPSRRKRLDAARARTDSIVAENMERLERLRARARRDSLRRDSLQRADAIRRADSSAAATPRHLPDARTPA